ncbi:NIPSNAP family protein [Lysobacter auxotrophicus]|uniref:NIPSNAP family protein n=1 Tax=Lysobacter auxotrophicus TaxID=2992573 RepID=A0ABM8DC39_9GAMM|nr:NIPSNAP family protein [Lysobacter auxotrophicus]BDU16145.1 NIPSNAP family protein [Lysobacter auxotrophicus]
MSSHPRLLQIRTYQLAPGSREGFHRAFVEQAVPMLQRWAHEVVAFGPSPHQDDAYFLLRAYDDLADLNARQDAFYGSPEWRQGPREHVLAMIRHYQDAVLWASPEAIDDLRRRNAGDAAPTG